MALTSILSSIGKALEKVFKVGAQVAIAAEPFIDSLYPGISPLFTAVVSEVVKAEGLAIAAGAQNGTGPQKLASVLSAVEREFQSFARTNNLPAPDSSQVTSAVNGLVMFLNALPGVPVAAGQKL
jgi:hypothetical protein